MIPLPESFRVALQNGVAHVVDGRLQLRRFRSDHGTTGFIIRSAKAVSALLDVEAMLNKEENQVTEPGCSPLPDDYVVYWAPGRKGGPPTVTLALEPMGLETEIRPFRMTLTELMRIGAVIRAAQNEGAN